VPLTFQACKDRMAHASAPPHQNYLMSRAPARSVDRFGNPTDLLEVSQQHQGRGSWNGGAQRGLRTCERPTAWLGMKDSNSEMSSQIIPLKARADSRDPTEFRSQRLFAFELRRWVTQLGPVI
jgi:hypothetical protein